VAVEGCPRTGLFFFLFFLRARRPSGRGGSWESSRSRFFAFFPGEAPLYAPPRTAVSKSDSKDPSTPFFPTVIVFPSPEWFGAPSFPCPLRRGGPAPVQFLSPFSGSRPPFREPPPPHVEEVFFDGPAARFWIFSVPGRRTRKRKPSLGSVTSDPPAIARFPLSQCGSFFSVGFSPSRRRPQPPVPWRLYRFFPPRSFPLVLCWPSLLYCCGVNPQEAPPLCSSQQFSFVCLRPCTTPPFNRRSSTFYSFYFGFSHGANPRPP